MSKQKEVKTKTFVSVSERVIKYFDSKDATEKDGSPLKLARILLPSIEGYKESFGKGVSFVVPAFLVSDGKYPVNGRKLVSLDTDRPVQISIPHKEGDDITYETKEISAESLRDAFTREKTPTVFVNVSVKQITIMDSKTSMDEEGKPKQFARILIPSQEGYKRHIGEGASFILPIHLVKDGRYANKERKLLSLEPGRDIEVSIPDGQGAYRKETFKAEEIKEAFTRGERVQSKDMKKEVSKGDVR